MAPDSGHPPAVPEETRRRWRGQWVEPELGVVRLRAPAVLVLGTVVDEQEEPSRRETFTRLSSSAWVSASIQCRSSNIRHTGCTWLSRSSRCLRASNVRWRLRGIEGLPLRVLDRHLQERQQSRQPRLQGPVEGQQLARHLLTPAAGVVSGIDANIPLEQIEDGQVVALP